MKKKSTKDMDVLSPEINNILTWEKISFYSTPNSLFKKKKQQRVLWDLLLTKNPYLDDICLVPFLLYNFDHTIPWLIFSIQRFL